MKIEANVDQIIFYDLVNLFMKVPLIKWFLLSEKYWDPFFLPKFCTHCVSRFFSENSPGQRCNKQMKLFRPPFWFSVLSFFSAKLSLFTFLLSGNKQFWDAGMGVPAFFRWLSKKYPSIVVHCVEEKVSLWAYIFSTCFLVSIAGKLIL